ncbi:MAG: putative signal transducing protein [Arenimonas sp.]
MSEINSGDWVIVDSFIDVIHADIVRGRLEAEGIPAILGNRHLVTAEWLYSQAMGGVQILVPIEQIDEARTVIAQIDSGGFAVADEELQQQESCKVCGTTLVRKTSGSWKFALFIAHFVWLPVPFRQNLFSCPKCET